MVSSYNDDSRIRNRRKAKRVLRNKDKQPKLL